MKISIFEQSFDFWTEFRFLNIISIFYENFDFWTEFRFLNIISIFYENFDFSSKFKFLIKISISDHNFHFGTDFEVLTKIWIFDQNFIILWFSAKKSANNMRNTISAFLRYFFSKVWCFGIWINTELLFLPNL